MKKPNSIVTRSGDGGKTRLFSGEEVDKDHPRTRAYGDVDELVSILGVAAASAEHPGVPDLLHTVQRRLFLVGAELAVTPGHVSDLGERIDASRVEEIDRWCESLEERIEMPKGFILPGGTIGAAHMDHARTVARRVERGVVGLTRDGEVENAHLTVWLNRLSDLLWLLAREEEGTKTILKDE